MKIDSIKTKVDGVWKTASIGHVKVDGIWKPVNSVYVKINGQWSAMATSSDSGIFVDLFLFAGDQLSTFQVVKGGIYDISFIVSGQEGDQKYIIYDGGTPIEFKLTETKSSFIVKRAGISGNDISGISSNLDGVRNTVDSTPSVVFTKSTFKISYPYNAKVRKAGEIIAPAIMAWPIELNTDGEIKVTIMACIFEFREDFVYDDATYKKRIAIQKFIAEMWITVPDTGHTSSILPYLTDDSGLEYNVVGEAVIVTNNMPAIMYGDYRFRYTTENGQYLYSPTTTYAEDQDGEILSPPPTVPLYRIISDRIIDTKTGQDVSKIS